MDRGMVSEENLAWLRQGGRHYLVGKPRTEMKRWARELSASEGWKTVRDGLEVEQCEGPDGKEVFLLCRSRDRQSKEHALHERAADHIRAELGSLGRRLKRSRTRIERGSVDRQVGRILERQSSAAKRFEVQIVYDLSLKSEVRLSGASARTGGSGPS